MGYTLDELRNDITRETPASFEPTIDYCVVKVPRFTFEKFPQADPVLTTQMKSVGEAMAIGRTFKEAMQKALRSLETGRAGFGADGKDAPPLRSDGSLDEEMLENKIRVPTAERVFSLRHALLAGWSVARIHQVTGIDPWFLQGFGQNRRRGEILSSRLGGRPVAAHETPRIFRPANCPPDRVVRGRGAYRANRGRGGTDLPTG